MKLASAVALGAGLLFLVRCDSLVVNHANLPRTHHIGSAHPKCREIHAAVRRAQEAWRRSDWVELYRATAPSRRKDRLWSLTRAPRRSEHSAAILLALERRQLAPPEGDSEAWAFDADSPEAEALFSELMTIRMRFMGPGAFVQDCLAGEPLLDWVAGSTAQVCIVPPGVSRDANHTWVTVWYEEGWYTFF